MAFGKGGSFSPDTKVFNMRIATKDLPAPVFIVTKKGEDGKQVIISKDTTRVSGTLIGIQHKVFKDTKNNTDVESVTATIQDGKEVYFVSISYTFIGRNLLNSLLNLTLFTNLEISLYQSKPKPDAKDQRGFASVCLRQDKVMVYGKYKKEELPAIPKITFKGKEQGDDSAINAWFAEKIKAFSPVVRAAAPVQAPASDTHADTNTPNVGGEGVHAGAPAEDTSDIPF